MKRSIVIAAAAAAICAAAAAQPFGAALGNNSGFDDLSRGIEASIAADPVAAAVFNIKSGGAVEVFAHDEG